MKCRLPMKIGTPGGGGVSYPDGAFIPVTKFTDGKTYALVAKINGTYRYINTTTYNNYTMNATVVEVTEKSGYVLFGSEPATFVAKASGDGFTLGNDTNYLHGTTSNGTALRYGTTSAVWKVDTSETGGFDSGKYLPKEVSSSVWLKNTSGSYDWSIKFESAGSFGYDRAGRDNTYSTGFVSFVLYEKWDGQTGGDSGGDSGGGDDSLDYHDNFADNDWATIAKVCAEGLTPTTWKAGDSKNITISSSGNINGGTFQIDIIGIRHDDFADGSGKAPFTFQFHDCLNQSATMARVNNTDGLTTGGWRDTQIRNTYPAALLAAFPSELKTAVKEVNKKTSAGAASSTIYTTADTFFLVSEIEAMGTAANSYAGEGAQYEYYKNGGSKIKKSNGSAEEWWLRSPAKSSTNAYCRFNSSGAIGTASIGMYYCMSFAFCLGGSSGGSSGGGSTPTIPVSITGTGDATYCYAIINGTKYYSAGTYEVKAGDKITFGVHGKNASYRGWVQINGTQVLSVTGDTANTYDWTVPSGTSTVSVSMDCNTSFAQRRGRITVTTS